MIIPVRPRIISQAPASAAPTQPEPAVVKSLNGHSGAILSVRREDGRPFVRKTSGSPVRNDRLAAQAQRQLYWFHKGLPCPRFRGSGIDGEGRFFFDMDYVVGRTLAEMVTDGAPLPVAELFALLDLALDRFEAEARGVVAPEAFHGKIDDIVRAGAAAATLKPLAETIAARGEALRAADWSGIPEGPAHGDLTLENVMAGPGGRLLFIDFDEPWVSSPWLDLAKLFQDVTGHWCLRKLYMQGMASVALLNATARMDGLFARLIGLVRTRAPALEPKLPALVGLNLFRTLPYVQDTALAAFVLMRMGEIEHRFAAARRP